MLPQVKLYQVFSNGSRTPILEIRREDQWSSRNARFSNRHNQLRSIRSDSTRFLLEMKLNTQFTIQKRYNLMTPEAERFNGWAAMLGFVAAVGAYATTGQIIPGIF